MAPPRGKRGASKNGIQRAARHSLSLGPAGQLGHRVVSASVGRWGVHLSSGARQSLASRQKGPRGPTKRAFALKALKALALRPRGPTPKHRTGFSLFWPDSASSDRIQLLLTGFSFFWPDLTSPDRIQLHLTRFSFFWLDSATSDRIQLLLTWFSFFWPDSASSEFASSCAAKKTTRCTEKQLCCCCTKAEGKQRNKWEGEGKKPRRPSPVYNSLFLPPIRKTFFSPLKKKASWDETS